MHKKLKFFCSIWLVIIVIFLLFSIWIKHIWNHNNKSHISKQTNIEWISSDCQSFFDGCNYCSKQADWLTSCTEMYCETYWEPRCTDISKRTNIDDFIESVIQEKMWKYLESWEKLFINYALLDSWITDIGNIYFDVVVNWETYYINERWELDDSYGFWTLPIMIEATQNENWYSWINYKEALDGNLFTKSIKDIFSKKAFDLFMDWKYAYNTDYPLYKMAEDHFWIKIIPVEKNNFECNFCDKIRYQLDEYDDEYDEEYAKNNNIDWIYYYLLTTKPTNNKTFEFKSDWIFETKWSWDEWFWTWVFGKNDKATIVIMDDIPHIFDRYTILENSEDKMTLLLDIIQKR